MQAVYGAGRPAREREREHLEPPEEMRLLMLLRICELAGEDPGAEVRGREVARDLEMPLEVAYAVLEYLSRKGDLEYLGAGPRVRITPHGLTRIRAPLPSARGRRGPDARGPG